MVLLAKDPTSHEQINSSFYDSFLGSDLSCHDLIYRYDHSHQSLINLKAIDHGSSSFLSFDQESYSKSGDHEKDDYSSLWDSTTSSTNLDVNYFGSGPGPGRLFENMNCYQTSTDMNEQEDHEIFGLFFNEGNGHTIVGTNTSIHGAQVANSSNKRHADMGENNKGLKKQCTGAITKNKPKPKVVISKDPQSIAAKNRRERISERLKVLQELVPNGTKVDLVTMLEKAISYVKFLQVQVKVLATDEFWPVQGGKAPEISEVKEAIDAILLSQRSRK